MKISVTRLLDTAKLMATKLGQDAPGFISYISEFCEQTIRALRNGLTFADNFLGEQKTVSLLHGIAQVVSSKQRVIGIIPIRVVSQTHGLSSFGWYYDDQGELTVKISYDADPAVALDVSLVLLF